MRGSPPCDSYCAGTDDFWCTPVKNTAVCAAEAAFSEAMHMDSSVPQHSQITTASFCFTMFFSFSGGNVDGDDRVHGGAGGEQQTTKPGHRAKHRGEDGGDAPEKNEVAGAIAARGAIGCSL